jgi:pimeloyl-ACP methyl ester carboxylesterase
MYYVAGLRPPTSFQVPQVSKDMLSAPLSPIQSAAPGQVTPTEGTGRRMLLVLGGYSYGSLITSNLPSTDEIASSFTSVDKGTTRAEIMLRAHHLTMQWNEDAKQNLRRSRRSLQATLHASPHSTYYGGEESEPGSRRASRESRRSIDFIRRSSDRSHSKLSTRQYSSEAVSPSWDNDRHPHGELGQPVTCYLLISPLLPPVSMLATMFTKINGSRSENAPDIEDKFQRHPTLAIYGDRDFFTSYKKLRRWAAQYTAEPDSLFTCREISGAGHFWHEDGADAQMRKAIRDWLREILGSHDI